MMRYKESITNTPTNWLYKVWGGVTGLAFYWSFLPPHIPNFSQTIF